MFITIPFWAVIILASALALGFYDLSIKQAVRDNPVVPVVFLATLCGTAAYLLLCLCMGTIRTFAVCTGEEFVLISVKSILVAASWLSGYYAIRELPISIALPIRATAPLWTFLGSVILFSEVPSAYQAFGMAAVFTGYYLFSILGKLEGISFRKHKGIHMVALATLLGAASALYDKYLLGVLKIPKGTVQFYFSVELVVIFGFVLLFQKCFFKERYQFHFRWWIPATGILLISADYLYFWAVGIPGTQIAILSLIRRCGCIVGFTAGVFCFHDKNVKRKAWTLGLILGGVILLVLAN